MRSMRRSGITALTAAIALSFGAVPVALTAGILPRGDTTTITPTTEYFPGPTLTLATDYGMANVTLSDSALSQTILGGQYCELSTTGDALLEFGGVTEPGGGTRLAGFREGSLGVYEGTNASQCFRVDAGSSTPDETLTVSLGGALSGLVVKSATFDLQMKSNDNFIVVTVPNAADPNQTRTIILATGKFRTAPPAGYALGDIDLAPRARSGDHVALAVPDDGTPFTSVALKAVEGSFTLEGGGDGGTAVRTTLTLGQPADATFCSTPNEDGETNFLVDENGTRVDYLGNVSGSDTCFGVLLTSTDTEVRFLKPSTVARDAQFLLDVDWVLPNTTGNPGVTIPDTVIDFEVGAVNITDLPFCSDFTGYTDGSGDPILTRDATSGNLEISNYDAFASATSPFVDYEPESTDKEWGCIDTRSSVVTAQEIVVHDLIFVIGDLKMTPR